MMQTDELRAELAALAREVDPFESDVTAIQRRVARRRVVSASVAVVLIVGLVAGAIAITRSGPDRVEVTGHPKEMSISALPRVDALVGLPARATEVDIALVRALLDKADAVQRYAVIPRRFFVSNNDQGDFLVSRDLRVFARSTTFGVELDRSVPDAQRQLAAAVGTAALVRDWAAIRGRRAGDDVEIFMTVKACETQISALSVALKQDQEIESFRFFSHADALREFKRLFSGQPSLIQNTKAGSLPTSFQLRLRDGVMPGAVAKRYERFPGVSGITTPANPFANDGASFAGGTQPACAPKP